MDSLKRLQAKIKSIPKTPPKHSRDQSSSKSTASPGKPRDKTLRNSRSMPLGPHNMAPELWFHHTREHPTYKGNRPLQKSDIHLFIDIKAEDKGLGGMNHGHPAFDDYVMDFDEPPTPPPKDTCYLLDKFPSPPNTLPRSRNPPKLRMKDDFSLRKEDLLPPNPLLERTMKRSPDRKAGHQPLAHTIAPPSYDEVEKYIASREKQPEGTPGLSSAMRDRLRERRRPGTALQRSNSANARLSWSGGMPEEQSEPNARPPHAHHVRAHTADVVNLDDRSPLTNFALASSAQYQRASRGRHTTSSSTSTLHGHDPFADPTENLEFIPFDDPDVQAFHKLANTVPSEGIVRFSNAPLPMTPVLVKMPLAAHTMSSRHVSRPGPIGFMSPADSVQRSPARNRGKQHAPHVVIER